MEELISGLFLAIIIRILRLGCRGIVSGWSTVWILRIAVLEVRDGVMVPGDVRFDMRLLLGWLPEGLFWLLL